MSKRLIEMKMLLALAGLLAVMVAGAVPALAHEGAAEETTVTGVVSYEGTKADGTPVYGITDETTLGGDRQQQEKGYLMEGDYGAYLGKRITVHGTLESGHVERVLKVTRVEG